MQPRSTDTDLVQRLRRGDADGVSDLARQFGPRVLQLALRHVRNREDAEEVAQDVLLKVARNIGSFRGDSKLSSWIYRITFNAAMSHVRRQRFRSAPDGTADVPVAQRVDPARPGWRGVDRRGSDQPVDGAPLADVEVYRRQIRRRLVSALAAIPPIYRTPILLRDVHGLSTEETSAELGVRTETLKSRLHRGRLMLRSRLSEFTAGMDLRRAA
jgi:RNA polymerase sigma-70 factor (ECF subfamily)